MTIIDYVIEDLERITQLADVPEQERQIIGDQISRLRMYQSSGMDSASIKAELASLQAKHAKLREAAKTVLRIVQPSERAWSNVWANCLANPGQFTNEVVALARAIEESEGE